MRYASSTAICIHGSIGESIVGLLSCILQYQLIPNSYVTANQVGTVKMLYVLQMYITFMCVHPIALKKYT
jgi:hypothetical protein